MPKYSWDKPAGPGGGLAAPLLLNPTEGERSGLRSAGWSASLVKDCPSDEIEWPQYELLEARGCCDLLVKFHRYIWFMWYDPLMKLGAQTHLEMSHIWRLAPCDSCEVVYNDLQPLWEAELSRAKQAREPPNFMRACAEYCRYYWGVAFCLRFVAEMTNFIRPLCMQQVLLTLQVSFIMK